MAAPSDANNATTVTKPLPSRLPNRPFSRKPANGRRGMSQSLLSMYGKDEGRGQKAEGTNRTALGRYDFIPFCLLLSAFILFSSPRICRCGERPRISPDLLLVPGSRPRTPDRAPSDARRGYVPFLRPSALRRRR